MYSAQIRSSRTFLQKQIPSNQPIKLAVANVTVVRSLIARQADVKALGKLAHLQGRKQHGSRVLNTSSPRFLVEVEQHDGRASIAARGREECIDVPLLVRLVLRSETGE